MDKFKKNWKPILAGVALITGGTFSILTGLIAGGALTASGLVGFLPGLIAGPATAYSLVGGGGGMVGAGILLIACSLSRGGPTRSVVAESAGVRTNETRSSVFKNTKISSPEITAEQRQAMWARYQVKPEQQKNSTSADCITTTTTFKKVSDSNDPGDPSH